MRAFSARSTDVALRLSVLPLLVSCLYLLTSESVADDVAAEDALNHVGEQVRVQFKVQGIGQGGGYAIVRSRQSWKEPECLLIRIDAATQADLVATKPGSSIVGLFANRRIEVEGVVEVVAPGGLRRASITVTSADAIRVIAPRQPETTAHPTIQDLRRAVVELHLVNDRKFARVRISNVEPGSNPDSLAAISVQLADGAEREYRAREIEGIFIRGVPLDLVRRNVRPEELVVDQAKRSKRLASDLETQKRVQARGGKVLRWLSEEDHDDWMIQHREFVENVQSLFANVPLRTVETSRFLFLTDLPASVTSQYLENLDSMYETMCRAYELPPDRNVWCGKCVVIVFQEQENFIRFEKEVMKNKREDLERSGGLCHAQTSGRVIIALWKGNATIGFAHRLIHETSHGFLARYRTNVRMPSWLNEGMADWIACQILETTNHLVPRRRRALAMLHAERSLQGMLDSNQIKGDQYGVAVAIVDLLMRDDPDDFKELIDGIKAGFPPEVAFQNAYQKSYRELARELGRQIGIPALSP